MIKHYIAGTFVLATLACTPVGADAQTTTNMTTSLQSTIERLLKQVAELKKQLSTAQGELTETLKDGLKEGATDEDIKKIQELLATDPSIYPRGLVSGYYGPLTKEAVQRFQARHELKVTGEVDAETKGLLLEYFKERTGGKIPPGLLIAPGIDKKIKDRLKEGMNCEKYSFLRPFCKKDTDNDQNTTAASSSAARAIDAAEQAINDLEEAIDDSSDEDEIADAEDVLDEAETLLKQAEAAFTAKRFTAASDAAKKVRTIALQAIKDLDSDDVSKADAEEALDDAKDAIEALEDAIDDAENADAIDDAEEALDDAKDTLNDAEEALDDEDYDDAAETAEEAEEIADDAREELEDAA